MKGSEMKIRRTYKEKSLKFGKVETVDEAKARLVFGQTMAGNHAKGACGTTECTHCPEVAIQNLVKGAAVETFFSKWELIEA